MTQEEKYNLKFEKKLIVGYSPVYHCLAQNDSQNTVFLSELLSTLGDFEAGELLEELNFAINGEYYEECYRQDGALFNDSIQIKPPIVIINMQFEFPLMELKLLLDEWVLFCKANS
jgi:hypothetical protein